MTLTYSRKNCLKQGLLKRSLSGQIVALKGVNNQLLDLCAKNHRIAVCKDNK